MVPLNPSQPIQTEKWEITLTQKECNQICKNDEKMTDQGCKLIALLRADIGNYEKNRRIYSIDYASP